MIPEAGEYVGPYEILGRLGAGGMGIVFRAWDERLHREVALKLLHNQYDTPNLRERFLIEARAASALNHPNICTIYDLGEESGEPFLVMELLSGYTLKDKIGHGALGTEEIVRIGLEVSDALAWAHSKGVIHRDVKPANVFLQSRPGGQSQAKVLDFGLAKVTGASRSGRASRALELTAAGSTVGTLAYMSPEQARGETLDARSDLFSMGVILYEMCTRRVPFRGATSALVFTALLSQDPESIRNWNDAIPRDLERVVYRLLAKDRSERFQSAHDLHEALRRLTLKGDGDWLRKLPRPAVPLVASADPVARARRGWRAAEERGLPEETRTPVPPASDDSDPEVHLLRPRRLPRRESGPRESAFGAASGTEREQSDPTLRGQGSGRLRSSTESSGEVTVSSIAAPGTGQEGEERAAARGARLSITSSTREGTTAQQPAPDTAQSTAPALSLAAYASGRSGRAEDARNGAVLQAVQTSTGFWQAEPADEEAVEGSDEAGEAEGAALTKRRRRWLLAGALVSLVVAALVIYKLSRGTLTQVVLHPGDAVLLAPIQNKTGDADLDLAIAQGLEIELAENSALHFDGLAAYRAGTQQIVAESRAAERTLPAQLIAQRIGARAYLYGELSRSGSGYTLTLNVVDAASNDRMATLAAESSNRDGLASAITEISVALRRRLGEGDSADTHRPTPLGQQATATMAALQSYCKADLAVESGQPLEGIRQYRRAAAVAPGFALAQIRLAWLLEEQGAEVEAAEAAQAAQAYSRRAGDRVHAMAQYTRQALADGDLAAATQTARTMTVARPQDVESLMALARVMRLGGHTTEALLSSDQAVRRSPFHAAAYTERVRALVGLGRYSDALRVGVEATKAGVMCDCGREAAEYLSTGTVPDPRVKDGPAQIPGGADMANVSDLSAMTDRALALDDAGRLTEGLRVWRETATEAQNEEGIGSAASGALAQAALNRALVGQCREALVLVGEAGNLLHGPLARARSGVARSLCGVSAGSNPDEAGGQNAGLHSLTVELYRPVLRAAEALREREPLRALGELSGVHEQRDVSPVVLYLRGTARLAGQQLGLAADDFSAVAAHRGRSFLSGTAVYGPALASLIRAQLESGDRAGAARTRTELRQLYANADAGLISNEPAAAPHRPGK